MSGFTSYNCTFFKAPKNIRNVTETSSSFRDTVIRKDLRKTLSCCSLYDGREYYSYVREFVGFSPHPTLHAEKGALAYLTSY